MATSDEKVVFDVGGQRFSTTLQLIERYPDSLLPSLCKDCHVAAGSEKEILIERNPSDFEWILDIYRDLKIERFPPGWSLDQIQAELDFYQLPSIVDLVDFTADILIRMEQDALMKVAKGMCKLLCQDRERIFSRHCAYFLVWKEIDQRTTFGVKIVEASVAESLHKSRAFLRKLAKPGMEMLNKGNLACLSRMMLQFGFGVSEVNQRVDQQRAEGEEGALRGTALCATWENVS